MRQQNELLDMINNNMCMIDDKGNVQLHILNDDDDDDEIR